MLPNLFFFKKRFRREGSVSGSWVVLCASRGRGPGLPRGRGRGKICHSDRTEGQNGHTVSPIKIQHIFPAIERNVGHVTCFGQ